MWREAIAEIPKMWKSKPYSYEGKYFRVPERNVFPKPYGPAHPAMRVAAGSPPTFGEAAELGLGAFCLPNGAPSQLAPLVTSYKSQPGRATPAGHYVTDNIMGVTHMIIMEYRQNDTEIQAHM